MLQRNAVLTGWKQFQEGSKVIRLVPLVRHELPEDRPELGSQFGETLGAEFGNGFAAVGQHPSVGGEARCLDGKFEALGNHVRPAPEELGLLQLVMGGVDLDRRQASPRKFELFRLREFLRIKGAPPGIIVPAADADVNCR